MKQLKMTVVALGVALALGSSAAAQASVVTLVTSGTIASGVDYLGLFGVVGQNLSGMQYTQTISTDLGSGFTASGNSHYQTWNNPDTATLTGRTVVGGTTYTWHVDNAYVAMQLAKFQTDGLSSYPDQIYLGGGNFNRPLNDGELQVYAENSLYSYSTSFVNNLNPYQQLIPSTAGLSNLNSFSVQSNIASTSFQGSPVLTYVALNAVPEPESWAMMALGLGAVGALARRKRGQASKA